jgi:hypothetical protein
MIIRHMDKRITFALAAVAVSLFISNYATAKPRCVQAEGHPPAKGILSDRASALRIADIYLRSIYGSRTIDRQRPLRASLQQGVWHVEGTWQGGSDEKGGVAEIELCQVNGQVVLVTHEK